MSSQSYSPYVEDEKPDLSVGALVRYLASRPSTLFTLPESDTKRLNPIPPLRAMKLRHWNWYMMGFLAWTVDAMDFFVVSASASAIAESLNVTIVKITWGMTLVLMFRSVGAVIFGTISDTWGRKWSYIACCLCFVALEIGMGFITSYKQFLAVRALFGISMGGKSSR
ncbi:Jen1p [Sugiyamaella lignohabitans]|uniref:Jen1p n=1 Tax=Sugiyamaella lignohabitans TaxID=796027 RepID=A0A161HEY0_9ASCO|nr:Jen1p [Sugiyamaella lignohabitans]ANB13960.1 Jen1p [Sugiyamaella lignohabitans]